MKSIMTSVSPYLCEKTASGQCKILVRKSAPKEVPFKAYIYCTKSNKYLLDRDSDGSMFCWDKKEHHYPFKYEKDHEEIFNGKVIGEFICDKVNLIKNQGSRFSVADEEQSVTNEIARQSCLDYDDMVSYLGNKDGYGLHISDLKIYDKPKELSEFYEKCNIPESKCKLCDNCFYKENGYGQDYAVKKLTRPPQSYMFVEEI